MKMKRNLTLALPPIILATSIFMIVESGEFYADIYKNSVYKGYWAAFLVEMFLTIFAIVYFKNRLGLNIGIKTVMICLFFVMIAGASFKIIHPLFNKLNTNDQGEKLTSFLLKENTDSKAALLLLKGQRTNTALQAKHQRKISSEIITNLKTEKQASWLLWCDIILAVLIRFSVQIANLITAHILGIMWRDVFKTKRKYVKKDKKFWNKVTNLKIAK